MQEQSAARSPGDPPWLALPRRWQRQQQTLAERAAKDAAAMARRASAGAQRPQARSLRPRPLAAQCTLQGGEAAPAALAPGPAAVAVRRLPPRAPMRFRLGRAGSGGAGLEGPGKAAARAGRAKQAGELGDLADPDVAVLQPEQLAALRRTLAAVGACAARGSDPVPGPSLASTAAAAALVARHSRGSVGERAGHGAGRQREAAEFGLPAICQRLPAQVRRTAAGARENTDPNPDPDPVPCTGKASRAPDATVAPAEVRKSVLAAPEPTLPAAPPAAPAAAWTIPVAPGPASKPASRAGHMQAASGRVCKPRVRGAGRRAAESDWQAAPAAPPAVTAGSAAPPAPSAMNAAPVAGNCSAGPAPEPDTQQGSDNPDESAAAGAGKLKHERGRGSARPKRDPMPKPNPKPNSPPRPAWLLGSASGSWEAAGRESCVRGAPLWGDLWRGPDPGQAGRLPAEDPLLWESAGPSRDAGGLRMTVTVRHTHDTSPVLAKGACQAPGAGLARGVQQEPAAHPGAGPCEGRAHAPPGSLGSSLAQDRAVRSDLLLPGCGDGAEGAQAAGQLPGTGTETASLQPAARPVAELGAGHGSRGAQAHGIVGSGGGAGGSAVAAADLAQDPGGLAQDPGAGEADGVTAASGYTAAALAAALAALEREASGDDLLRPGLDAALPPAAGALGATAGAAIGECQRGATMPGLSRGAAGGEAYASLESLEAAVAELAAGLGPADAESLIKRMELAPAAPDATAVGSVHPDGAAAASVAAGSVSGRQGGDLLDVLCPAAAGDLQGSGYLAGLETLAEAADWGAGAAALDALVDELEALAAASARVSSPARYPKPCTRDALVDELMALAAAAGAPSGGACAPASGHGQVRSPGLDIAPESSPMRPLTACSVQVHGRCLEYQRAMQMYVQGMLRHAVENTEQG